MSTSFRSSSAEGRLVAALEAVAAERFSRSWMLILLGLVMGLFLWMVRIFLVPAVMAAVIVSLAWPMHLRIRRLTRGNLGLAALLSCVVLVVGLMVPLYAMGNQVAAEAVNLYASARPQVDDAFLRVETALRDLVERGADGPLGSLIPRRVTEGLELERIDWAEQLRDLVARAGNFAAGVINTTSRNTLLVIANLFIMLFTMFYFFRDGEGIVARLKYLSPLEEPYERLLTERLTSVARAMLRGSLILGGIQASLGMLTLAAAGVRAPLLWGALMLVLSFIPLMGTWIVMYPMAIGQALLGNYWQAAGIVAMTAIVITNIDNVLRPRLVGRGAGLHDLLIFFGTLGGIFLFGPMGVIIGPVIAALFVALLEIYAMEYRGHLEPDDRAVAAVAAPAGDGALSGALGGDEGAE